MTTSPALKVSINMPVYSSEKFIREALDSLLAQTFIDLELIISDNASTHDTGASCREYAVRDERIRYVRQPENRVGDGGVTLDRQTPSASAKPPTPRDISPPFHNVT